MRRVHVGAINTGCPDRCAIGSTCGSTSPPVARADLMDATLAPESSAVVAARVSQARRTAKERWLAPGWTANADAQGSVLRSLPWRPGRAALDPVERAMDQGLLSARGYDRVLRIAWTIADLAGHVSPDVGDVSEALYYRTGRMAAAA